jgi:arginase family enzyme
VDGSVTGVAIIGLLCRTSDRTAGGARGAAVLAGMLADRLGVESRMVGTPGEPRATSWEADLRDSRGCILEAGGQVEDALGGDRFPLLCASDCTISLTTLPTVARVVPGAQVLWLDAHGDFNTPSTTRSGFLGGMCLAGACGRWRTGFDGSIDAANLILVGSRDLDAGERAELELAGVPRVERPSQVADAVDGADVYVHLDLDVLDPSVFPAQFPAPGGLSEDGLHRLLDEVSQAAGRVVGVEITAFEAPEDPVECERLATLAADAVMPLLPVAAAR